jgi:hypothetical protein
MTGVRRVARERLIARPFPRHQSTLAPTRRLDMLALSSYVVTSPSKRTKSRTQHGVRGNRPHGARTVGPVGLDGELSLLTGAHVKQALVPALDDLPLSNGEAEWLSAAVRCVKFGAVALEGSAVVHVDLVSGLGLTVALDGGYDFGFEVLTLLALWQE